MAMLLCATHVLDTHKVKGGSASLDVFAVPLAYRGRPALFEQRPGNQKRHRRDDRRGARLRDRSAKEDATAERSYDRFKDGGITSNVGRLRPGLRPNARSSGGRCRGDGRSGQRVRRRVGGCAGRGVRGVRGVRRYVGAGRVVVGCAHFGLRNLRKEKHDGIKITVQIYTMFETNGQCSGRQGYSCYKTEYRSPNTSTAPDLCPPPTDAVPLVL